MGGGESTVAIGNKRSGKELSLAVVEKFVRHRARDKSLQYPIQCITFLNSCLQVLNNANLDSSSSLEFKLDTSSSRPKKGVEFSDLQPNKTDSDNTTEDEKIAEQIRRMAASAVAAAVAGATAQQIAKSKHSTPAIKAASAAAEVAQAVVNGNSDGAAQAVSKVAKIVEEENSRVNATTAQNGSVTRPPPKSTTCVLF